MMARRVRSEHESAWAVKIGQMLAEVLRAHDLTPETFAKAVHVPATKVYRWLNGTETPHLDRFLQFDDLHVAIVVGMARLIDGVDVAPDGSSITIKHKPPARGRP
jgi:predicted transcriptional regulator